MTTTSSGQQVTDSLNGKLTFEQDKNRIVGRDEDNKIGLLIQTDPFLMKIAKYGFDVLTATDDQLIFNSGQNVFKIVQTGTAVLTNTLTTNHTDTLVQAHGLGYTPAIIAYVEAGPGLYVPCPWVNFRTTNGTITWVMECFVDNTNMTFSVSNYDNGLGGTTSFRYYLLQETAN